jgi:hypothetical protein
MGSFIFLLPLVLHPLVSAHGSREMSRLRFRAVSCKEQPSSKSPFIFDNRSMILQIQA